MWAAQDPYHNTGQAMGLSFSVPPGKAVPSSLQNIYKELRDDCACTLPKHGDLEKVTALPPAASSRIVQQIDMPLRFLSFADWAVMLL